MKTAIMLLLVGLAWPAGTPPQISTDCYKCVYRCRKALDPGGCRSMCYQMKSWACQDLEKGPGPSNTCSCT